MPAIVTPSQTLRFLGARSIFSPGTKLPSPHALLIPLPTLEFVRRSNERPPLIWVDHGVVRTLLTWTFPIAVESFRESPFRCLPSWPLIPLGRERFVAELKGLTLIHERAGVTTPAPVGSGIVTVGRSVVLLMEALSERRPETRSMGDWRSIGSTLARIHQIQGEHFGLHFDGLYGFLRQQNVPVSGGTLTDFFVQRRLIPMLRSAVDSGNLLQELQRGIEAIISRMDSLSGPDPRPTLLHGDAQQHNFVSTDTGAAIIDPAPYFATRRWTSLRSKSSTRSQAPSSMPIARSLRSTRDSMNGESCGDCGAISR